VLVVEEGLTTTGGDFVEERARLAAVPDSNHNDDHGVLRISCSSPTTNDEQPRQATKRVRLTCTSTGPVDHRHTR
jgi:hypothetical protein